MDPNELHIECTRMVRRTRSIICEVERKMKEMSVDDAVEDVSDNVKIDHNQPAWLRCLLWFCHT